MSKFTLSVTGTFGSREVDFEVRDPETNDRIFGASGSYCSASGDWLCLDVHNVAMLESVDLPPDPDEEDEEDALHAARLKAAKRICVSNVSGGEDGIGFDDPAELVEESKDEDVSYL